MGTSSGKSPRLPDAALHRPATRWSWAIAWREFGPGRGDANDWTPVEDVRPKSLVAHPGPMDHPGASFRPKPSLTSTSGGHVRWISFLPVSSRRGSVEARRQRLGPHSLSTRGLKRALTTSERPLMSSPKMRAPSLRSKGVHQLRSTSLASITASRKSSLL